MVIYLAHYPEEVLNKTSTPYQEHKHCNIWVKSDGKVIPVQFLWVPGG